MLLLTQLSQPFKTYIKDLLVYGIYRGFQMTKLIVRKFFCIEFEDNERLLRLAKESGQSQTQVLKDALKLLEDTFYSEE